MYRRILIGGLTAAAIVGGGGAALAATGSNTTSGTPASASSHSAKSHHGKKAKGHHPLRRVDHAEIVIHTKKKGFVTRQLIRGTVTDVSASSITVTSADHTTDTFSVTKDTLVATRSDGKRQASTISKVAKGDHVFVGGTGASNPVARHIFDRGSK